MDGLSWPTHARSRGRGIDLRNSRIDRPTSAPLLAIGGALLGGVLAWLIGVTWYQSAILSGVVLAIAGAYYLLPDDRNLAWPTVAYHRGLRSRRDVARLSWALTEGSRTISMNGIIQLEELAEKRLALRGVRIDDREKAEQLLGPRVYELLISKPSMLGYDVFAAAVSAVEALDDVPLAPHRGVPIPEGA